jgi:hypothetical protein
VNFGSTTTAGGAHVGPVAAYSITTLPLPDAFGLVPAANDGPMTVGPA